MRNHNTKRAGCQETRKIPDLNSRYWTAAFILPKGVVLEAINPAKYMLKDVPIAQKNPAYAGQEDARGLETAARTLPRIHSEGSVAENGRACQGI